MTRQTYAVEALCPRGTVLHTTYVDAWPGRETSPAVRAWMRLLVGRNDFRLRARVADPVKDLGCVPAVKPPAMTHNARST